MGAAPLSLTPEEALRLRARAQRLHLSSPRAAPDVLADVLAVQAQDLAAARLSLRARGAGPTAADVDRAREEERSIVWTWTLRGTLHLVSAADARWLLTLVGRRFIEADRRRMAQLGWDEESAAAGLRLLHDALREQRALTRADVVRLLGEHDLPAEGQAPFHLLFRAALEGMICLGPGQGRGQTYVLLDEWLGVSQPLPREEALTRLAERYLAAYGPARVEDLVRWSGLPAGDCRRGWERLADRKVSVTIGDETAWLLDADLARLEEPPGAPVVRLLPRFDTYLLGYASRDLALDLAFARRVHVGGGIIAPTLVVDGRVLGTWRTSRRRGYTQVIVEPFGDLGEAVREGMAVEVADMARFLGEELWLQIGA